jgi:glycosyltransferase involved in cell wall biosynthesis
MVKSVSIIICTRNRADALRETLASIRQCVPPAHLSIELLAVDNGSTDATKEVIESAAIGNMETRYVFEARPGKGYAYNTGILASTGAILLFTDDDVRVPVNWIGQMCEPLRQANADAVAGGVELAKHLERPWLVGEIRGWVACTEGLLDPVAPRRMVGANMAFKRHVLNKVPFFDVELGPGALGLHDETLFSDQLLTAGFKIVSEFQSIVQHHPLENRITARAFIDTATTLGRCSAYRFYHWCHGQFHFAALKALAAGWWYSHLERRSSNHEDESGGPSKSLMRAALKAGFHRQYVIEMKRARNYARNGLVKTGGRQYVAAKF